jgi:hypothetical protein
MEKISWPDRVRNEEVLLGVKENRNILPTTKRKRKVNWISHILCGNCHIKHNIEVNTEGRMGVTRRRERQRKQLLNGPKEKEVTGKQKRTLLHSL